MNFVTLLAIADIVYLRENVNMLITVRFIYFILFFVFNAA